MSASKHNPRGMVSVDLEESVYAGLERRVSRFGETPNDVIKRILALVDGNPGSDPARSQSPTPPPVASAEVAPDPALAAFPVSLPSAPTQGTQRPARPSAVHYRAS